MGPHTPKLARADEDVPRAGADARLLAQRTLFAGPSIEAPDQLYAVAVKGVMVRERDKVVLDGHAVVTTNTYFGRFPASYWQRWTSARQVEVTAVVSGAGILRVMASDSEGERRTVAGYRVEDALSESVTIPVEIDKFIDGGAL
jgi:galactofuranosylgalactofuranosylrhamnosyl-N-acetylglucosaminyl-diphospho-decaprenol beta-1,5/1,6-galactofuranosyltransferase